ncbi:MAG: transcription elongation factor GreA [Bacteroidetes bacterium]|nr:transcription elongation factor GreA [Bacteroidota bacterium]
MFFIFSFLIVSIFTESTVDSKGTVYLTRERMVELEKQLQQMKSKGRAEMASKIAEARAHGDLSENAEYDAAKEEQGLFELRISKLEDLLSRARIIKKGDLPKDAIYILSDVTLEDLKMGGTVTYKLVSPEEADFEQNKISVTSPIGKALMKRHIGDLITVQVPAGTLEYKIIDVS